MIEPVMRTEKPTSFRLAPVTIDRLRRLAAESGASQAALVDAAVWLRERTWSDDTIREIVRQAESDRHRPTR